MKVAFISGLFPNELKKSIETNSKFDIQCAANSLQWNFANGLNANLDKHIQIITAPLIGSFPLLYKKIFLKRLEFDITNNSKNISIGFCNIAIIKNYFIRKALIKELRFWSEKNPNDLKIIVVYGMLAAWVLSAVKIKESCSNIKLCLIVPDLPEFMNNSQNFIFKLRDLFQPNLYQYISRFDCFVFLTNKMARHFKVDGKPWIRIEGMINPEEINKQICTKVPDKKIVMYSGTLAERYGILELLEAFQEIKDQNYELWICGSGETEKFIEKKAKNDNRIKYLGLLTRERVLELQRRATVLVNPRNSDGEYTYYSFPSKIMEYLLSGTPIIMNPLPGIPSEYYRYVFLVLDNSKESLRNKIIYVCNLPEAELKSFGELAKNFVLEQKNYKIQAKKMIELFNNLK